MSTSLQQAIIREIWNSRFKIHSLRPLQSKVTHVTDDKGILKFHVEHQIIPTPFPSEMIKPNHSVRKRELKYRPQPLATALSERGIRSLTVSKHLPIEQALIARLKQYGIIIHELTVEKISDRKPLYLVSVLRSPYLSKGNGVKLTIHLAEEDLLATEFLDGDYNSSNKQLILNPTSYTATDSETIRYFYGSVVGWVRNSDYLKVTVLSDCTLNLYGNPVGDLNDYKSHLELQKTASVLSEEFKVGEHFELKFGKEETLFIKDGEVKSLPAMDKRIALSVVDHLVASRDFKFEITSME